MFGEVGEGGLIASGNDESCNGDGNECVRAKMLMIPVILKKINKNLLLKFFYLSTQSCTKISSFYLQRKFSRVT